MLRLRRVDDDIAVQKHQGSRPGKARSDRSSCCHVTASGISANGPLRANSAKASAIAHPRSGNTSRVGSSSTVI